MRYFGELVFCKVFKLRTGNSIHGSDKTVVKMRLFFALRPDQAVQNQLLQWQTLIAQGQPVAPERLHVTLAFLGDVDTSQYDQLVKHASAIQSPHFGLRLNRTGYFRGPQIVWVGPSEAPEALLHLQQSVAEAALACGIAVPNERFTPHVTLARKAQPPLTAELPAAIPWRVTAFHLVQSQLAHDGPRYLTLRSFHLG